MSPAAGLASPTNTLPHEVLPEVTADVGTPEQAIGVLDAGTGAMIIIGADRLISLVNTQAERLFGYDRNELMGQSPDVLVAGRFRPPSSR